MVSVLLLIEKNKEKIYNLFSIGYGVGMIARTYQIMTLAADLTVWVLAAVMATIIYPMFSGFMANVSPGFVPVPLWNVWLFALLSAVFFAAMHSAVVYCQVRKVCKV